MGDVTLTYGDITPRQAAFADVRLLKRVQHLLVTERFGQARHLPKKKSDTIKFRRFESHLPATAPLAEGVTPAGQKARKTDVTCILRQYGDFEEITDKIQDMHEDPVLADAVDRCAEQAAETIEILRIAVLKAGSTVFYVNNVASRLLVDKPVQKGDLRRIIRFFNRNKAKVISQIVKASPKISTEPCAPAYFALSHTDLKSDWYDVPGFTRVENYSDSDKQLPGEIGKVEEIRVICTALFEAWSAAATSIDSTTYLSSGEIPVANANPDVYPVIIIAKDSYGIVSFQGKNAVQTYAMNPDRPSKSDKLAQRGYVGWKSYQGSCILNQLFLARYEVACTAKPTS